MVKSLASKEITGQMEAGKWGEGFNVRFNTPGDANEETNDEGFNRD